MQARSYGFQPSMQVRRIGEPTVLPTRTNHHVGAPNQTSSIDVRVCFTFIAGLASMERMLRDRPNQVSARGDK